MIITRFNPISGKNNSLDLPVTEHDLLRMEHGEYIQDVLPHLSADEREFMISGLLPGEFDKLMSEDED